MALTTVSSQRCSTKPNKYLRCTLCDLAERACTSPCARASAVTWCMALLTLILELFGSGVATVERWRQFNWSRRNEGSTSSENAARLIGLGCQWGHPSSPSNLCRRHDSVHDRVETYQCCGLGNLPHPSVAFSPPLFLWPGLWFKFSLPLPLSWLLSTMPALIPVDNTYGALLIGCVLSSIVYGVTWLQVYSYYNGHSSKDRWPLKYFVAFLMYTFSSAS
ncbi:hypothetical protein EDB86DRAFT_927621 [Lactarius hatsudake]|nr:hypothetical protein EDB86DRAFT_927621 [Lactarius hatsudake]